jgi:hypothetical protein
MREQDALTAKTQKRNKMVWTWAITALIAVAMGFVYVSARMPASTRSGSSTSSGTSFPSNVRSCMSRTASTADDDAGTAARAESGVRCIRHTYTMSPGLRSSAQNRGDRSVMPNPSTAAVADTSPGAYVIASCDGRVPY